MRAYVLIDTISSNTVKIVQELRRKPEVVLADIINGPHPVIALLESDDASVIARIILFDLRKTEGISDLTVYISSEEQPEALARR